MAGNPAATLLHLGPGFANAIAFLHNARKARQPVVNIVGDHAASHAKYAQAPLTSDIMAICGSVSDWVHHCRGVAEVGADGARGGEAGIPGPVATLVVPADAAGSGGAAPAPRLPVAAAKTVEAAVID